MVFSWPLLCIPAPAAFVNPFTAQAPGFFCPSRGVRRMAESAALLGDDILPAAPARQWVLRFPYALRFLFVTRPAITEPCRSLTPCQLKTPYRDGTTHVILELLDSMARPWLCWCRGRG